jgi:hypothetical protein
MTAAKLKMRTLLGLELHKCSVCTEQLKNLTSMQNFKIDKVTSSGAQCALYALWLPKEAPNLQ